MDIYDFFQNSKIKNNDQRARQAKTMSHTNQVDIDQLQDKVEHLSLVCSALCEVMSGLGVSQQSIINKVEEIDLRDGKLDGNNTTSTNECNGCGRKISSRHKRCMYCGEKITRQNVI